MKRIKIYNPVVMQIFNIITTKDRRLVNIFITKRKNGLHFRSVLNVLKKRFFYRRFMSPSLINN